MRAPSAVNLISLARRTIQTKDIWGSRQGIGAIKTIEPVRALVHRLESEYRGAKAALAA
jgi:nitronate monooxygenase